MSMYIYIYMGHHVHVIHKIYTGYYIYIYLHACVYELKGYNPIGCQSEASIYIYIYIHMDYKDYVTIVLDRRL